MVWSFWILLSLSLEAMDLEIIFYKTDFWGQSSSENKRLVKACRESKVEIRPFELGLKGYYLKGHS